MNFQIFFLFTKFIFLSISNILFSRIITPANVQASHNLFYLQNRKNKSLWGFFLRYRELIASLLTTSYINWWDLNDAWTDFFLDEAKNIDPDALNKKVCFFLLCKVE